MDNAEKSGISYIDVPDQKKYIIDNELFEAALLYNKYIGIKIKKEIIEKATPRQKLAIIRAGSHKRAFIISLIVRMINMRELKAEKDGKINKYDKSKYEPDHILSLIFNEKWRKEHLKIGDNLNDTKNLINNELLKFFQYRGLALFTKQKQNLETWHKLYLYLKGFINFHETEYLEYSKKCYLNKLKDIYIYKITNTIEKIHKSKNENTILDKINFFAYIEESSPTITTCEICYELYKIVYNSIKKYIKQHYRKYPKLSKDEYLKLLEQTYKLKLDNCRNKFKIDSMIGSNSSSSSSSSRSLSGSPPKATRSPKQTKIDDFFKVKPNTHPKTRTHLNERDEEKREPTTYNHFMREEMKRIKEMEAKGAEKMTAREKMGKN
jgi:hypothetical protein